MRKIIFIAIHIFVFVPFACMNYKYYVVKKDGTAEWVKDLAYYFIDEYYPTSRKYHEERLAEITEKLKSGYQADLYNDYGVTLVYLHRYQEAKRVFIDLKQKKSEDYAALANLGTLYELSGKTDSALYWIRKSVEINPASHDSSEWIHVNILAYKLLKPKTAISSQALIGTDFGTDSIPTSKLSSKEMETLKHHIYHQLTERMSLVKPKDKIVAQLLFDLGNLVALTNDLTSALHVYEKAISYGYHDPLIEKRIQKFEYLEAAVKAKGIPPDPAGGW